jgi:charged multivesicular body protein 1
MDPQISLVMDKFESQFADLDVQTSYMEGAMHATSAVAAPQDEIESLMRQTADEANLELAHDLNPVPEGRPEVKVEEEKAKADEDKLSERLRALRPAS